MNFSRVTPAQLAYISFPSDGRYQPVRPVSTKSQTSRSSKLIAGGSPSVLGLGSEKYAGGGGILILMDSRPNEPAEFIETEPAPVLADAAPVPVQASGHIPVHTEPTGRHISLDESAPEADPPEPFEVCPCFVPECCFLVTAV
jgi:26S proteasome regulatory subunit N2